MRPRLSRWLIALVLTLSACGAETSGTVTDDLGRSVAGGAYDTVVPLAPNVTELVAAAAGTDRLAGVSLSDDFPPGIESRPRFQSLPLDTETVLGLEADLALGSDDVTPTDAADGLAALGLPTYLFTFERVADVPRALRTLDTLLTSRGGADAALAFEQRVEAVQRAVSAYDRPRVLLLVGSEEGVLYAFGRDSYASEVVRLAGGDNLTDVYTGTAAQPSLEAVLEFAPQVIVVAGGGDAVSSLLEDHPALVETPAARDRRIYALEADLVLRAGPRLVEGLERLARQLHPRAFAAGAA